MSVLDQLARARGRRDEKPNVELAARIAAGRDGAAVAELALALSGPRAVQGDAIKVLYEVGAIQPALIAPHMEAFLEAARSKNNRLAWGALTALDAIAATRAPALCKRLPEILAAAKTASVIGKDRTVALLCKLTMAGFGKQALPALLAMLADAPVNQLPMYAEMAEQALAGAARQKLCGVLATRLKAVAQASKRKRIEKVLRKLEA